MCTMQNKYFSSEIHPSLGINYTKEFAISDVKTHDQNVKKLRVVTKKESKIYRDY